MRQGARGAVPMAAPVPAYLPKSERAGWQKRPQRACERPTCLRIQVSRSRAGTRLDSRETMVQYIRTTKTSTGVAATAYLVRQDYAKGVTIPDEHVSRVCIDPMAWRAVVVPDAHTLGPVRWPSLQSAGEMPCPYAVL